MKAFDWPALMRAGMQSLALIPSEFWALTPAELQLMLGQGAASPPLTRVQLEELSRSYPDSRGDRDD